MEPWKPIEPPFDPPTGAELPPGPAEGEGPWGAPGASGADPDFELLENYLDAELSSPERRRVERRLAAEPELSAALARMSAEYALRQAAFRSLEPDDQVAEVIGIEFVRSIRRADGAAPQTARTAWSRRSRRIGRFAGALAACVAVSFGAGWVGRGYAANSQAMKSSTAISAPSEKAEPSVYQVALTDEAGKITAVQKFDNLEEAQSFAADLGRWQARQQQLRRGATATGTSNGTAAPAPTSSEF